MPWRRQIKTDRRKSYWSQKWNWLDLVNAALTIWTLLLLAWHAGIPLLASWPLMCGDSDCIQAVQAVAILASSFKLLFFMRGFNYTAFLITVLSRIVSDMSAFLLVLFGINGAYVPSNPHRTDATNRANASGCVQLCICILHHA